MRALRVADAEDAAAQWPGDDTVIPVWLRLYSSDSATEDLLLVWTRTPTWPESFDHLAEHADALLTDRAEASLEHLIDNNPGSTDLDQHLDILRAARANGVEAVRDTFLNELRTAQLNDLLAQWIGTDTWTASAEYLTAHASTLLTDDAEEAMAGFVGERPGLLHHLGLLGLARLVGVDEAHAVLTVTGGAAPDFPAKADLPLARLAAGLDDGSAERQFAHALAALAAGGAGEAAWAMARCREGCASWERASLARRLDDIATANPDLDLTPLTAALNGEQTATP